MNPENAVVYLVRFQDLSIDQLDELTTLVARELGGNMFDAMTIEPGRVRR